MAKVVLAGPSDDPFFPRCELLADTLKNTLPNFDVDKIFVQPDEWGEWLQSVCSKHGWDHKQNRKGPIVWRELVNRGGKAILIGDSNDFQEFCRTYYGVKGDHSTNFLEKVAHENQIWANEKEAEKKNWLSRQNPAIISIWNATTNVAQLIMGKISLGNILPYDDLKLHISTAPWMTQPVSRTSNVEHEVDFHGAASSSENESFSSNAGHFHDQLGYLEVIKADLEDLACDNIRKIINFGSNVFESVIGAKLLLIIVDDTCNNENSMDSFKAVGRDLEATLNSSPETSDSVLRVLFIPGSVEGISTVMFKLASNFVEGIISSKAENSSSDDVIIPDYEIIQRQKYFVHPDKVLCLTTPLENAAKSLISKLLQVKTCNINDVVLWSRPDTEQQQATFSWPFYVDVNSSRVAEHLGAIEGPAPYTRSVIDLIAHEKKFLQGINEAVVSRAVTATGRPLALSSAACDFLQGWFGGEVKHTNLQLELYRRNLVFSTGICKLNLPYDVANPKLTPAAVRVQEQASSDSQEQESSPPSDEVKEEEEKREELPRIISTMFQSLPIRFIGSDDLEGTGYELAIDFTPPAEMFHVPTPPKAEGEVEDQIEELDPASDQNPVNNPVEEQAPAADEENENVAQSGEESAEKGGDITSTVVEDPIAEETEAN